jgi:hypothetical protein
MPMLRFSYEENPAGLLYSDQKSFNATEHLPRELVLPPLGCSISHAYTFVNKDRTNKPEIKKRFIQKYGLLVSQK